MRRSERGPEMAQVAPKPAFVLRRYDGGVGGKRDLRVDPGQTPVSLGTTVKLGRASAGLVLCAMLNAATGRRRPFSSKLPRSSNLATASTASAIRLLIRICPSFASAHSLAARLQTVPIAV